MYLTNDARTCSCAVGTSTGGAFSVDGKLAELIVRDSNVTECAAIVSVQLPSTASAPGGCRVRVVAMCRVASLCNHPDPRPAVHTWTVDRSQSGGGIEINNEGKATFEGCHLYRLNACDQGGFARIQVDSLLRLQDSFVEDCAAGTFGGAVSIEGADVEFASTTLSRCRSGIPEDKFTDFDSTIPTSGTEGNSGGAAISSTVDAGRLTTRDLTVVDCLSQFDSGILVRPQVELDIALLTLHTPPCDKDDLPAFRVLTDQGVGDDLGNMDAVRGLTYVVPYCPARGAQNLTPLPSQAALPNCTGGNAVCGVDSICADVPVTQYSDAATQTTHGSSIPTTPVCSCEMPNVPLSTSELPSSVTPVEAMPFSAGCATPHRISGVGIAALVVSSVVLDLDKPNSASRTLTLRTGGTVPFSGATWVVDETTVPEWLVLDTMSGTFTGDVEAPILTMTAYTSGVPERNEPYEARLLIQTNSTVDIDYIVPVQLLALSRVRHCLRGGDQSSTGRPHSGGRGCVLTLCGPVSRPARLVSAAPPYRPYQQLVISIPQRTHIPWCRCLCLSTP